MPRGGDDVRGGASDYARVNHSHRHLRFSYTARTREGQVVRGALDAPDQRVAEEVLRDRGLIVVALREQGMGGQALAFLRELQRPKPRDIVVFLRQFAVMVAAQVPLVRALRSIARSTPHPGLRAVIFDLVRDVESGRRLSDALASHPRTFTPFAVNLVRAGETSSELDAVITYLADQLEREEELRGKVRSAMVYPAFILVGLTAVAVVMMVFVIPRLTTVLTESGATLPLATRALIATSAFLAAWWWLLAIGIVAAVIGIRWGLRNPALRTPWDRAKLSIPAFGSLFRAIAMVRFARAFDMLLRGGVDLVPALRIVRDVIGNAAYGALLDATVREVEDGNTIASVFVRSPIVPPMATQLLAVGEETGQLQEVLRKLAEFYAREVDARVRNLVTVIEPLIMIVMGLAVGVMVAAVIMPMYNLTSQF